MNINKELEEKLKDFPRGLESLALDILEDISNPKKSKKSIESMILEELNYIIQEEE